jgi:hypothetical protein
VRLVQAIAFSALAACGDTGLPNPDATIHVDAGVAADLHGMKCEEIVDLERTWLKAHSQCRAPSECVFFQARAISDEDCGVYMNATGLGAYLEGLNAAASSLKWCDPGRRLPACRYSPPSPTCANGLCVDVKAIGPGF